MTTDTASPTSYPAYTAYPSLTKRALEKDLFLKLRFWYVLRLLPGEEDGGIRRKTVVVEAAELLGVTERDIQYILFKHSDSFWRVDGPWARKKIYPASVEEVCRLLDLDVEPVAEERPLEEIQGPARLVVTRLCRLYDIPCGKTPREATRARKEIERLKLGGLEPLLNLAEAAELLQLPEAQLIELAREGKVPGYRIGLVENSSRFFSQLRFERTELLDWAEQWRALQAAEQVILETLGPEALTKVQGELRSILLGS